MIDKFLKKYRSDNNLSQKDISEILGIKQQQYSRIENKTNSPSFNTILEILSKIGYEIKIDKKEGTCSVFGKN